MSPPPAEHLAARLLIGPALRAQSDRRLVDLVRSGYDAAFEEIVRRYRRPLDRFAGAIVGGRSEDVTQDALSKALTALRGAEAEIELRPWLYRIVRNTALNDLRDRAPAGVELPEALPGGRSAAAEAEAREELAELLGRLRALPESQRTAIVMREFEGLGHEEIAAALRVSGGAARQAIHRARAALRDGLGLLIPLPLLRALAEHSEGAAGAGGAIAAGTGATAASGAAVGSLGGGALKAGVATLVIAGTLGAGVAIDHHRGQGSPTPAAAAPLAGSAKRDSAARGRDPRVVGPLAAGDGSASRRGGDGGDRHGSSAQGPNSKDSSGGGGNAPDRNGDSSGASQRGSHSEDGGHSGRSGGNSNEGGSGSDGGGSGSGSDGGEVEASDPQVTAGGSSGSGSESESNSGPGSESGGSSESSGSDGGEQSGGLDESP
jgi:RNA polymerase sigma factor (sigma-70 family)